MSIFVNQISILETFTVNSLFFCIVNVFVFQHGNKKLNTFWMIIFRLSVFHFHFLRLSARRFEVMIVAQVPNMKPGDFSKLKDYSIINTRVGVRVNELNRTMQ